MDVLRGYLDYQGFYGPIDTCANSGYQALFLARKGPGDEATSISNPESLKLVLVTPLIFFQSILVGGLIKVSQLPHVRVHVSHWLN